MRINPSLSTVMMETVSSGAMCSTSRQIRVITSVTAHSCTSASSTLLCSTWCILVRVMSLSTLTRPSSAPSSSCTGLIAADSQSGRPDLVYSRTSVCRPSPAEIARLILASSDGSV